MDDVNDNAHEILTVPVDVLICEVWSSVARVSSCVPLIGEIPFS
jgi:hypothetical protein